MILKPTRIFRAVFLASVLLFACTQCGCQSPEPEPNAQAVEAQRQEYRQQQQREINDIQNSAQD